jgi:broad specificity phosphatase PhoE
VTARTYPDKSDSTTEQLQPVGLMKRLILVRHAEPDWPKGVNVGRNDPPLTAGGLRQAVGLSRALANQPISQVLSSSRSRAVQTAEPIAQVHGVPLTVPPEDFFNDFAMGDWEGKSEQELDADPLFQAFLQDPHSVVPPGAAEKVESVLQMRERVEAGLHSVFEVNGADCALVVTHADIIRIALTYLFTMDPSGFLRFSVPRASITVIDHPLHRPTLSRLGWTPGDEL